MGLREQLLEQRIKVEQVTESVYVRELRGTNVDAFLDLLDGTRQEQLVQTVLLCCCDQAGNLLFRPEDAAVVAEMPLRTLQQISDAALAVNGFGGDGEGKSAGSGGS